MVMDVVPSRDDMRLALILEVREIGLEYVPGSFDWLSFPKAQVQMLIHMALEIYFKD